MKKVPASSYDLYLSGISDEKSNNQPVRSDFVYFMKEENQPATIVINGKMTFGNQSWTLPNKTYCWFPHFKMYLIEK